MKINLKPLTEVNQRDSLRMLIEKPFSSFVVMEVILMEDFFVVFLI